ncbi:unnamed protein product [Ambrosiozyma monospora]|uniref:Unnamed protein product n=1 Tax=Ambrosiozyma monospora TaxID=43982 RepID=A0A9W7DMX2_AMBMO|nr:unnamed protein product [Ambrosiozyma monospora]
MNCSRSMLLRRPKAWLEPKLFLRLLSTETPKSKTKSVSKWFIPGTVVGLLSGWFGANYFLRSNPPEDVFPLSATTPISSLTQTPKYATSEQVKSAVEEIKKLLRTDQFTDSPSELHNHSDNSSNFHKPNDDERPYLITYPETTEEVQAIVKICYKYNVPMVPYSGGTSIEGHFIPTRKGISIDVIRMDKVLALHEDDLDVVIQPGVGWQELGDYLKPHGLLFGPDPGPGACIGGMVATNCSGTRATRYGTMKDNVIALKVVLSDGTLIKTKNRPRKSSAGYNLTGLFVGSEGTLGIIVEATLKLSVLPEEELS